MTQRVRDVGGLRVVQVLREGFVPLERVLQRPARREGVVLRGELVDLLREQPSVPVVSITGPPGYGKTTLVRQWEEEDERPFLWLTVEPDCNDPAVLVTYLLLALQRLAEPDAGVLSSLADQSQVSTVLLPRLGRMLRREQLPFVVVLDDAELLTSAEGLEVVTMLAQHLSPGAQVALVGRAPPRLPWSRLRAERGVLTIGQNELRLRPAEAQTVLAAVGVEVSEGELGALLERTEGWPAGVYLAALSLRQAQAQRSGVRSVGGRESAIGGYLREELLAGLPLGQQRFLVDTSILERMCAPLCDAVLERTGSAQVLDELDRANLFVVPLGGSEPWYRFHRLFREMLLGELVGVDPARVRRLHAGASRWLEEAGFLQEAVAHAQAAGATGRAARMVWAQAGAYLASGRAATLRRWLDGFPNGQVVKHAELALTAAWCALEAGRPASHWVVAAEQGVQDVSVPGQVQSVAAGIALLRAERCVDGVQRMRQDAQQAARLQPAGDPWRAHTDYLTAVAVLLSGAPAQARPMLEAAGRLAEALTMPMHQALCWAQLAALAVVEGRWEDAAELTDGAVLLLADGGVGDGPLVSPVHCVQAMVLAKAGRTDQARQLARRCVRTLAMISEPTAWLATQTRYLLGRAYLLTGDSGAARVLFSEAQTHLRGIPDASWLREALQDAWAAVEKFPLATGVGPSALTSAEMRVLQLLPTHLSSEQIGRRLLLSRNTVKTQAIAVYRKLGVGSRSDAVERARALGMV
ncbi:MAG TPA: AAA family ATPase [Frankiaceae bacterium]|nr:AAA family ATPase [Frankiaceae bacterium]